MTPRQVKAVSLLNQKATKPDESEAPGEEDKEVRAEEPEAEENPEEEEVAVEEEPLTVEPKAAVGKGSKGRGRGSQTGDSSVAAITDAGTTMSSSSAMRNLLIGSLRSSNAENRQRVEARLAELAAREADDYLTEDETLERQALEDELRQLEQTSNELKAQGRARATPEVATKRLSQGHHDSRYRTARAKGIPHHAAWRAEKARRRAALNRQKKVADRAKSRLEAEAAWTEHFRTGEERPGDRQDNQRETDDSIATVVIDKQGRRVEPKSTTNLRPLTRKERTYYREEQDEELKPSSVPKAYSKTTVPQEVKREKNRKRNLRRQRTAQKHKADSIASKKRKTSWWTEQEEAEDEEEDDPN